MDFIIQSVMLLLAVTVGYLLKELPRWIRERDIEKTRLENSLELQRENFFREISGSKLEKIFEIWVLLLLDTDKELDKINRSKGGFMQVFKEVILYGSEKTINIVSSMNYYLHSNEAKQDEMRQLDFENAESITVHVCKIMYFTALCVSSFKFDFTGYEVEPEKLLRMYLKDYTELEKNKEYKKIIKEVKDKIS